GLSNHQAKYFAHELQRSYANDHVGKLAGLLFDAQVEPKPHQIDAALFALQTPFLPGVILADEVGLGKTIEAGIVISQYWAERRRDILVIAPSSLRQQWQQELSEKFLIPSSILEPRTKDSLLTSNSRRQPLVLICSYEFALRHEASLLRSWDLVIADEAHRLRNFWTGKGKVSDAVSHIVRGAHKTVLLTATPLQNKLEELYGLVSVFDPDYFYSLDAFRERYVKHRDISGDDLADRVAVISKRTLRRDADKYIHFTKRLPLTVEFTPSEDERRLYNLVNEYLQRPLLYAFAGSQRHLSALIIRKRLGSSTYAVASTLENIANRLAAEIEAGQRRDARGGIISIDFDGDELTSEELEEAEAADLNAAAAEPTQDDVDEAARIAAMKQEVAELREFAALARSITVNQKAVKLVEAIGLGFERLRQLGAPEKAIIFTDSTKTQEYIARSLTEAGLGDGLVLFNGSNTSPEQNAIYQAWLEKNKDGDLITGIPAVDRRKALVEYFRLDGTIMIATEAAAEGINLQFCSMVVNYDLPWNPQRVEQRIGRAHRFGQKYDVVVVNLSNKGNLAEQRILQLLDQKFHLFSSVFGASDEVLGAIEDGLDFEKTISNILNSSRTDEEILDAFLGQFYEDKPIPRLALLSHDVPNRELLAEAFCIQRGSKVELQVPRRGEKKDLVAHAMTNAREALGRKLAESSAQGKLLEGVCETFGLEGRPERIEVYDNSHIMGTNAVGGMIVAGPEGFIKNQYRKFNIKGTELTPGDDYGMMREVLKRRFSRLVKEEEEGQAPVRPDLVLIDGGAGQLAVARETMENLGLHDIVVAGVAKGPDRDAGLERFFIPGREPFMLDPKSPVLYYLQRLRDEAHRFAIGSHRVRRKIDMTKNPLDEIEGVGPGRKRALLHAFGSARGVSRAAVADLMTVDGISEPLAQRIHAFFRKA
ncbi:MAG: hypothetical protein B7Y99_09655, partial [Caulobacterales bacterium 32-69-10]